MSKPLIILGAGGFAAVAGFYFLKAGWKIEVHVVDDQRFKTEEKINGISVLVASQEEIVRQFPPRYFDAFVAIGYSKLNANRVKKCEQFKELGYALPSFIHPEVFCYGKVGEGCFILEHNTIQPFSEIGDYCIAWSGNHFGHHTILEKGVFVASHVCISSGCTIGSKSFLGVNSTLTDGVAIGESCIVQAGAVVDKNLEAGSVFTREGLSKVPSSRVRL